MAKTRKCLCCGEKYEYCPTCSRASALEPSWKSEFCGETCKDLWTALTKYGMDMITKSEAKFIISKLDLKPLATYADCVQRDYAKVVAHEPKPKKAQKIVEPVIEVAPVEQPEQVAEPAVEVVHEVVEQENE